MKQTKNKVVQKNVLTEMTKKIHIAHVHVIELQIKSLSFIVLDYLHFCVWFSLEYTLLSIVNGS